MSEKDDGGPAFPTMEKVEVYDDGAYREKYWPLGGMSLRDYFATHAPAPHSAWIQSQETSSGRSWVQVMAKHAYEFADAMLEARQK